MQERNWASDFWINLPVEDLGRSRAFFSAIGFAFDGERSSDSMACMLLGDRPVVVMLFPEAVFAGFAGMAQAASRSGEVLLSVDAASREAVDLLVERVRTAGGIVYAEPEAAAGGTMYGAGFSDPDGHRWNVLWMAPPGPA